MPCVVLALQTLAFICEAPQVTCPAHHGLDRLGSKTVVCQGVFLAADLAFRSVRGGAEGPSSGERDPSVQLRTLVAFLSGASNPILLVAPWHLPTTSGTQRWMVRLAAGGC
jgi:hypothetical protein